MFRIAMDVAKVVVANVAAGAAAGLVTEGFGGDFDEAKQTGALVALVLSGMELIGSPIISTLGSRLYNNIAYYARDSRCAVVALDIASAALSSGVKTAAMIPGLLVATTQFEPKHELAAVIGSDRATLIPFLGGVLFVTNVATDLAPEADIKLVGFRTELLSIMSGAVAMDKVYGTQTYLPAATAFMTASIVKGTVADALDPAARAVSSAVVTSYRAAASAASTVATVFCVAETADHTHDADATPKDAVALLLDAPGYRA